jgi:hypothetical protein
MRRNLLRLVPRSRPPPPSHPNLLAMAPRDST